MNTRIAVLALILLSLPFTSYADTSWSASVSVANHCTVVDSDGVSHEYSGQYLGICALEAAIEGGLVSGVVFSNAFPSLGLFVTGIEGVAADPSSQYWALYYNGSYASAGLSQLPVVAGDTLILELHDFSDTFLGDRLTLTIATLITNPPAPAPSATSGGGGTLTLHNPFDTSRAITFLWSKQRPSGSFGSPLLDDWVAIATAGGGAGSMRAHLTAYFFAHPPELSSVTDYERHAMALQALGINPYLGPSDYIAPIVRAFDGTQIGDPSQDNDDIFALFPLLHAGYTQEDAIIAKTTAFILSRQDADGSWDGSVDMTAAAVQALALVPSLPGTSDAITKALAYLHTVQEEDGGFGDVFATSWVMQAASALGQSPFDWSMGTYQMPDYYLATMQELDGGIGPLGDEMDTRVWATAYAIPAIERRAWGSLLADFPKPTSSATTTEVASVPAPEVLGASTSTAPAATTYTPQPCVIVTLKEAAPPATSTSYLKSESTSTESSQGALFPRTWHAITSFFSQLF